MLENVCVIIPTLGESDRLVATCSNTFSAARQPDLVEIIIVDAGGDSLTRVEEFGKEQKQGKLRIVHFGIASRGRQLNAGLSATTAPLILCLHADCLLPLGWDDEVRRLLDKVPPRPPTLGCFRLDLDEPCPSMSQRTMLAGANARTRWLGLPYGDQAYFAARSTLEAVGGFASIPLMEDVDLLYRLKPRLMISDKAVRASARRWKAKGVWRNTLLNQCYMLAWHLGVSPDTIYTWYYGRPPSV